MWLTIPGLSLPPNAEQIFALIKAVLRANERQGRSPDEEVCVHLFPQSSPEQMWNRHLSNKSPAALLAAPESSRRGSEVGEGSFPASAWLLNLFSLPLPGLQEGLKAATGKEPICVLPDLSLTPALSFWFHWQPQHLVLEMVFSTLTPSCTWGTLLMSCSVKGITAITFHRAPAKFGLPVLPEHLESLTELFWTSVSSTHDKDRLL